jgi:hypothetical protein
MDNVMRLIGWTVVGMIGASLINEIVYQLIPLPSQGVSILKAALPALSGSIFLAYCVYRGFNRFKPRGKDEQ